MDASSRNSIPIRPDWSVFHRRRPIRSDSRWDTDWESAALAAAERWTHLDPAARRRWLEQSRVFDRTRSWEGLDGLSLTAEMRATVAVQACLLTVNIGLGALADTTSVLIAARPTVRTTRHGLPGSIVTEGRACVLGEALLHGPVRIAWDRARRETDLASTTSVVIHEFAHKIDMSDGSANGTPPIIERDRSVEFDRRLDHVMERLRDDTSPGPLRRYAATNRAELFAVATEAFFLAPAALERWSPPFYDALADFYQQTPVVGTHEPTASE